MTASADRPRPLCQRSQAPPPPPARERPPATAPRSATTAAATSGAASARHRLRQPIDQRCSSCPRRRAPAARRGRASSSRDRRAPARSSAQPSTCARTRAALRADRSPSTSADSMLDVALHGAPPEELAHLGARLVQLRLRRAHAAAEDVGDLLVLQPLDVVQHQHRAIPRRQRVQRPLEPRAQPRIASPARPRPAAPSSASSPRSRFCRACVRVACDKRRVDRQPIHPGRQLRVAAELLEAAKARRKTSCDQLLGVLRPDDARDQREHPPPVALVEGVQRLALAATARLDQRLLGISCRRRPRARGPWARTSPRRRSLPSDPASRAQGCLVLDRIRPADASLSARVTALVLACFFLSGASGLVFEAVWTRELTLVFGSTTLAISTVLSVFMGGLGARIVAGGPLRRPHRRPPARLRAGRGRRRALRAAGAAGAAPAIRRSTPLCTASSAARPVGLSLARFVAAALLLLVPTTLMGATLPLLSRHFVRDDGELRRRHRRARSTRINTFGAVAGTFFGGFVLLPDVGVRATNFTAAATNLTLAARRLAGAAPPAHAPRRRRARRRTSSTPRRRAGAAASSTPRALAAPRRARRLRRLGRDRDGRPGAVDARAGHHHRLVGLLVHAHPAGVPRRPRRRRRAARRA